MLCKGRLSTTVQKELEKMKGKYKNESKRVGHDRATNTHGLTLVCVFAISTKIK